MTVARVALTKIEGKLAETVPESPGSLSVSTNSRIDKVEIEDIGKQKVAVAYWVLETTYSPKIGSIEVHGKAWIAGEVDKVTTKTGGKLNLVPVNAKDVHQVVLRMPLIVSINVARELGLPVPINFPTVELSEDGKDAKDKKGEAG